MYVLIFSTVYVRLPQNDADATDLRWSLITLTATTASLGAVIALPFTILRTQYNRRQTHAAESALLNDKLNAEQDDILTRAAPIDRLAGLATEHPEQIAKALSLYIRQLSQKHPTSAKYPQQDCPDSLLEMRDWQRMMWVIQPCVEQAVLVLGRLSDKLNNHKLSARKS